MRAVIVTMAAAAFLAGCDGGEHRDLQRELAELTKDAKGKVDPLPEVKTFTAFNYAAFDVPDPFGPEKIKMTVNPPTGAANELDEVARKQEARTKEPLEAFPLETLKMVGTLNQLKQTWALVRADQGIYRVRVGNYLGQNFGVITKVQENQIVLKELIQDGTGWAERESTLLLQEAEAKK
jgi:type IV pilus assembly protein PilP